MRQGFRCVGAAWPESIVRNAALRLEQPEQQPEHQYHTGPHQDALVPAAFALSPFSSATPVIDLLRVESLGLLAGVTVLFWSRFRH